MGWAIHVEIVGKKRNTYRILVGKPESHRPLGRPRNKFECVDVGLNSNIEEARTRFSWLRRGAVGGFF